MSSNSDPQCSDPPTSGDKEPSAASATPTADTRGRADKGSDDALSSPGERPSAKPEGCSPFANSFSVDIDLFSEECDLRVNNYRQAIHEEPVFPWTFGNPSNSSDRFAFQLTLRSDPHHGGSGRQPPRIFINWDGTEPFTVTAKNLTGRDVKCCMSVKVFGEDGSLRDYKKEKSPMIRAHNASFSLSGLCRCLKFLTQQGALLLQVRMEVCNGLVYESGVKKIRLDEKKVLPFKTLSEDIKSMMNEPGFDDVTLKVDDQTLACNKFLLCARSKVFRAMFYHEGMKEAQSNEVVIEGVDAATVKDMLEFVYADKIKDICLERTVRLLPLAERYDFSSLSGFCCEALASHLNVEHAAEVAVIAEQHQLKSLKEKSINFMLQNAGRVIKTEGWSHLLRACPEIANRIIASLSKYRDENLDEGTPSGRRRDRDGDNRLFFDDSIQPHFYINHALPNNPEEEIIPQWDVQEADHHVADEWNPIPWVGPNNQVQDD